MSGRGVRSRSVWKRLVNNPLSIVGLGIILAFVVIGSAAPLLSPHDPEENFWGEVYSPPSRHFPFGVDSLGRDLVSRIVYGARTSLFVGLWATTLGLSIGITLGSIAGYFGGWISQLTMRLADIFLSIPSLVLMIVIAAVLATRNLLLVATIIGVVQWPRIARVTRSKFLALREEDFVEAGHALGLTSRRIMFHHILPNAIGPIIVLASLNMGGAIISESSLSFLGLGDPRAISWGNIISMGLDNLVVAPWLSIFPGIAIFLAVWGFNLLGDALRDVLDVEF